MLDVLLAAAAEPFAPPLRIAFLVLALLVLAILVLDGGAVL